MLYQLPLKPLRLGDLASLSFRAFRLNWRYITSCLFWPSLLASISVSAVQIAIVHWGQNLKNNPSWVVGDLILMIVALLVLLASQWVLAIRATALFREIFGIDRDFQDGMKYANRRKWSVFGVYSFGTLLPALVGMYLGFVFLIIFLVKTLGGLFDILIVPIAFVLGLSVVVVSALAMLVATLLFAVLASEDKKIGSVIARSFELSFRYPFRGGSYMCLLGLSVLFMCVAFSAFIMPFELYEGYMVSRRGDLDWPFYLRVLEAASQTINNIISMGVAVIAAGLYYRDILYRTEGADLLERLEAIAEPR